MNKQRVLVSMMLTALLVAAIGVIPVSASMGFNGAGEPGVSIMAVTPIVAREDVYATGGASPAFVWGAGEPLFSYSGPFEFAYAVVVEVTDDSQKGALFGICDHGSPIGEASAVPVDTAGVDIGPEAAFPTRLRAAAASSCPPGHTPLAYEKGGEQYRTRAGRNRGLRRMSLWEGQ